MNITQLRCAGVLVLSASLTAIAAAAPPSGWIIAGSNPGAYDIGTDLTAVAPGSQHTAYIKAKSGDASGFATLVRMIAAADYRGQRIRLSALLHTSEANRAQLWMRVDGAAHKILAFDNMDSRPVVGTTDWQRYSVVLDVPQDSTDIAFGVLLSGQGEVWADQFQLEAVGNDVAATATLPWSDPGSR